jgi:3' terminal RNA ribose 2'-O-methyltransferase Hen1
LSEGQPLEETNELGETIAPREEFLEKKINLNQARMDWVVTKLKMHNTKRVVDLGCGEGKLLKTLLQDNSFEQIMGCDVSFRSLEIAKERLRIDSLPSFQQKRIHLIQTALTYRDKRLAGYDAATLIEVIEHMELSRLDALKRVVFEFAKPALVIITTPNVEYNVLFENLPPGKFRHNDHRFEWTRQEFQGWAEMIAKQYGYSVMFETIGNIHEQYGAPTQGGIFIRNV